MIQPSLLLSHISPGTPNLDPLVGIQRAQLELIRLLQVAQTLSVHQVALAHLRGVNALCDAEAAAVRIEDAAETPRGHGILHLVAKDNKQPRCH